ncbi:hypothetical protein BJ994_002986 [Arthrobacter pigmenti]|uniref:Lipoprotein n=1 Tax=Arthrobacter pigmenti TaxID=271432 RepID=A0A846RQS6_9MICC|nr:ribose-phosphate pyrophosphokinase-like domain-containing protein [Arthrobacter pigmenti]NJC23910.1 hypothetical protein [Arthrobacter pigmenti]
MPRKSLRVGCVALVLLTAGCGWIPQPKPGTEPGPNGELLVVSRTEPSDAVMQALFEGELFLNDASCVAGRSAEGYEVGLLFPRGSSFAGGDALVVRSGDYEFSFGVQVAFGGGFASGEHNVELLEEVPSGCRYEETFIVQTLGEPGQAPSSSLD